MNKDELMELAENPDFISGIYNYCDRWCERCPFTSRCMVYATERAESISDDPESHDINNAKFWHKLEAIFRETHEMILEWAEEMGVDLESAEAEAAIAERGQRREEAKEHPVSLSARHYAQMVQEWFKEEFAVEENVHDDITGKASSAEEDINVSDAVEVIRWYQFFIAAKTYRALMGLEEIGDEDVSDIDFETFSFDDEIEEDELSDINIDDDFDDKSVMLRAACHDSDGSAKIALIAIDRSLSAWRLMQNALPEKTESTVPMLIELEQLRRAIERIFPRARDFIRPGFDELGSEFVS
ncbi:MAG: hypothetical protein DMF76_05700 [Acidobacteria bacterium]|nr:MAG: hypothetical protein DMF76_05700 [Acidobacteriota bacterium]